MKELILLYLLLSGDAGYDVVTLQRFAVLEELADFLEASDFVKGNEVLLELQDFYNSCITSHLSDDFDIEPFRVLHRELGEIATM